MENKTIVNRLDADDNGGNLARMVEQGIGKTINANRTVAMRHMEVLSMQADETEALLQSGKLSDEQFARVMQEKAEIRQSMTNLTKSLFSSNLELIFGCCLLLLGGGAFYRMRLA